MPVRTDIPLALRPGEIQRALARGRRDPDWMRDEIAAAVEAARLLLRPALVFDWAAVQDIDGETVRLLFDADGCETRLRVGPNIGLLRPARRALVFVSTVGQPLDDAVRERSGSGDPLGGYLQDCVGVVALAKVSEAANALAEAEASRRGWGVGARLAPGSLVGWDADRQRELCDALPVSEAGISLGDGGLLRPFKSASGLVGVGPEYPGKTVGSVCGLCRLRDGCWRRR